MFCEMKASPGCPSPTDSDVNMKEPSAVKSFIFPCLESKSKNFRNKLESNIYKSFLKGFQVQLKCIPYIIQMLGSQSLQITEYL